jgi:inner membrane protein
MQKTLFIKIIIIAALMLLIGIPLMMIQSTIAERIRFHDDAVRSIAADSVGEKTILDARAAQFSQHCLEWHAV